MFSIGDIIYSEDSVCMSDCWFAIVEKITKTGKFRIRYIESKEINDLENSNIYGIRKTRVIPNTEIKSKTTILISANGVSGSHRWLSRCYKKYDDTMKVFNYHDRNL